MNKLNMATATKRYNNIMGVLGYEHNEIGTAFSENTENWNLRDMVAECDYTLSTYYENGHCNNDMRYSDEYDRKMWRSHTGMLSRFIKHYAPYVKDMRPFEGHCSNYD